MSIKWHVFVISIGVRNGQLCLEDLDNADNIFPTNRTDVNLAGTADAGTDMTAVIKEGVLLFSIADLAKIHLLIRNFPVAYTFAVALTILVATDVLVASLAFNEGAMTVALIFDPVTLISVTRGILHLSLAMALTENEVPNVGCTRVRDMCTFAVVAAFIEIAAVVVATEGRINSLCSRESLCGVVP